MRIVNRRIVKEVIQFCFLHLKHLVEASAGAPAVTVFVIAGALATTGLSATAAD